MGAPILLGGMQFQISESSVPSGERSSRAGIAVLSEIAAGLKVAGYEPTKLKCGKADDVRIRCVRRTGYIELILISEESANGVLAFSLDSWGYTRYHNDYVYRALKDAWQAISSVVEVSLRRRFAPDGVVHLSPSEVDARYNANDRG